MQARRRWKSASIGHLRKQPKEEISASSPDWKPSKHLFGIMNLSFFALSSVSQICKISERKHTQTEKYGAHLGRRGKFEQLSAHCARAIDLMGVLGKRVEQGLVWGFRCQGARANLLISFSGPRGACHWERSLAPRPCIRLDPCGVRTMKQSFASRARLRAGGPILPTAL